jgi:hypothetical protein
MSGTQNSLPVGEGASGYSESAPDQGSRLGGVGETWDKSDLEEGAELGGYTLLRRSLAPPVRRSLFRR